VIKALKEEEEEKKIVLFRKLVNPFFFTVCSEKGNGLLFVIHLMINRKY
jgi:hypothetical protein